MNTLITIVVIGLAFQAGLASSWVIAERFFIRPMRLERDKAIKTAKKAQGITEIALALHAQAVSEKRNAKKQGLILSPIQVQFPGERDD